MDNEKLYYLLLEKLDSLRDEVSKTNVLLERHNNILTSHAVDITRVESIAKEAKAHIDTCPARKKVESTASMIKDIIGLSALAGSAIALLKVFGVIK